jgi:hypothetical protein
VVTILVTGPLLQVSRYTEYQEHLILQKSTMNAEQVDQIDDVAVLVVGLDYVGFKQIQLQNNKHKTNIQRFHNIYGALPASCTQIMNDIQSDEMGLAIIRKPTQMHLLMTMYWLKAYVTETHLAGMFCLRFKSGVVGYMQKRYKD